MAKRRKRRQRIVALGAVAVMLLGFCVLAGTYFFVNVPLPKDLANMSQNSTIEYSNGKTLAKVGTENRKYVKLDKIPKVLQHAVVATEDRSFYTNSGIDVKGIFRAAWNNLTDDDTEGASTITQQYARNAAGLEGGYSRKLKEAVMAVKINQEYTKDQILEYYLNTIFFGRNANGVGAASEAYFGKPVHKLNAAESAMLAGVIKNPSGYDAAIGGKDRAEQRWRLVLKNMTDMKFLDAGTAAKLKFPKLASADKATGAQFGLDKPQGNVTKYVIEELGKEGITEQELYNDGYTIRTTIDKRAQRAANSAIVKVLKDQKDYLTGALVAVEPGTGEVKAYWGSKNGHNGFDNAAARHQPGSSFKAYVLAAALEEGISVKSYWDGSSPQRFEGRKGEVRNADNNNSCKRCTLERATVLSLNTAYYALTEKVGKDKVIDLASRAGVREMKKDDGKVVKLADNPIEASKEFGNEVGIGQYPVSVLDNANGFATFANKGVSAKAHFVKKAFKDGKEIYSAEIDNREAFSPETAADATHVMRKVVQAGGDNIYDGRPSAGKTGTWQLGNTGRNAHAWMAGYTPQLASAVWMGSEGKERKLVDRYGADVYGSTLPGEIWKIFMSKAMGGKPVEEFPEPSLGGDENAGNIASPSPSAPPSSSAPPSAPPESSEPGWPGGPTDPDDPEDTCQWFCNNMAGASYRRGSRK